jgi:uncharacterized membrane protein
MGISAGMLPTLWIWGGHVIFGAVLFTAIRHAQWPLLWRHRELQHLFLGAIALLIFLWHIRAGISPGLEIHFLGLTALTLVMGWCFAVIVASLVLLSLTLIGYESFEAFSFNALVVCIIPVCVSYCMYVLEKLLKFRPFFAYIFIGAFFGGALAVVSATTAMALLLWWADVYGLDEIIDQFLIFLPLIAFPEGLINGTIITALLVYAPEYLKTLDQSRYRAKG